MVSRGKVYLLGAGPGDPELVTLRARRRLAEADVVLYDALVHPDILDVCRPEAERVFVGKRGGKPSERQDAINARMVEYASQGKVVARLKGGDPFLFGRGSEEAEFLSDHGVPFEVVPGVPSPLAATAYCGISLTHRDLASSVAYVTATERPEKDATSHDWSKLATATQTLVIFMGLRRLRSLMQTLVDHGRSPDTPAAVVQWASMPQQRTVVATVATLADAVEAAGLAMPALTIVGEVVRLREKLSWWDRRPLFGRRVVITRAREQASTLATLLRDAGATPVELPTIRITEAPDSAALEAAARDAHRYDAVFFASNNAVDHFFEAASRAGLDARCVGAATLVAVGEKTAQALLHRGLRADLAPRSGHGRAAAESLIQHFGDPKGKRVLVPRSRIGREEFPALLRASGAEVDEVVAYDTLPPEQADQDRIRDAFREGVDAVLFTSSSTVENLVSILGDGAREALADVVVGSIGPTTTATAERLGIRVDFVADAPKIESLVSSLEAHVRGAR